MTRIKTINFTEVMAKAPERRDWESVQNECADLPGEEGITRRREAYAGYFLRLGKDVRISAGCRFAHPDRIVLDDDVRINAGALIYGSGGVRIGRHARIGPRVFIHSANHDVQPGDERAYFERGYEYESVSIGDNCLISANVSILPGARIANGAFIACGTVVTKGEYPDGCRLMGVPGRIAAVDTPSAVAPTPSVALVVPGDGPHEQAAKLLIEALGLPQVCVHQAGKALPASVHTTLVIGSESADGSRTSWTLADGPVELRDEVTIALPAQRGEARVATVPAGRMHAAAPVVDPARPKLENAAELALYYALKRLRKRRGAMAKSERLELHIAATCLLLMKSTEANGLASKIVEYLSAGDGELDANELRLAALIKQGKGDGAAEVLAEYIEPTVIKRHDLSDQSALRAHPELAIARALRDRKSSTLRDMVLQLIPSATKAVQIGCFGLAGVIIGDEQVLDAGISRLCSAEMFRDDCRCVRSAANSQACSYSLLPALLLLIAARRENPGFFPELDRQWSDQFIWRAFARQGPAWSIESRDGAGDGGVLIDAERHLISRSLLDNWLASITVPSLAGGQYELMEHNYRPIAAEIEKVWLALFRSMLHQAGEPLIRLHPWPHGCRAALSLRYDIDRNTTAAQLREIVHIQCERLNGLCASWFAISSTPFGQRMRATLPMYLQETGVHALSPQDAAEGEGEKKHGGVTFHSGPESQYWRGRKTVAAIEARGASYGEMLAAQLTRPLRAWLGEPASGQATAITLLPLHFPLEGSTSDTTLEYFDSLAAHFRRAVEDGGHVIIASHPDLNQNLLIELIEREGFDDVWPATIGDAVQRCKRIFEYGNITLVKDASTDPPPNIRLLSRHTLADLHVEIDDPAGPCLQSVCLQLNAGVPRRVIGTTD